MDESHVIALVYSGNTDAFAEIVENYQLPIIRYLYRLTGDHNLAQDLAQDTFLKAYQGILKTHSDLSFKAWLYQIATNIARQHQRRKRILSFTPLVDSITDCLPTEEMTNDRVESEILVQKALLKVAYDQRQCMVLHFVERLKYREIGEILGISEDAVRKRVARGSQEFRREYRLLSEDKKQ